MLIGIVFVVIGILYLLEIIVPGFSVNYSYLWPIILIICGLYYSLKKKRIDLGNSTILFVGIWWLLVNLNLIAGEYTKLFWPIILIIIGFSIVISTLKFTEKIKTMSVKDKKGILNFYGIFGGCTEKVQSKEFKGAIVYSIFGGCEIDFSNIEINADTEILIYSIFGGSEIVLPENYNIKLNSTGIFGGNENRNKNEYKKGRKTITINCISVLGGTEIK